MRINEALGTRHWALGMREDDEEDGGLKMGEGAIRRNFRTLNENGQKAAVF